MKKSDQTTPLLNLMSLPEHFKFMDRKIIEELHIRPAGISSIEHHKQKLGKQKYCWSGFVKHWVWESDAWRVYVSSEGSSFEVLENLSPENAIVAWKDYYSKVKSVPDSVIDNFMSKMKK